MKNAINFQVFNNAARYRSDSPLVNTLLLIIILVMIPVIIVLGIAVLLVMAISAKIKTMFSMNRSESKQRPNTSWKDAEEFTDYVVIEEEVGK